MLCQVAESVVTHQTSLPESTYLMCNKSDRDWSASCSQAGVMRVADDPEVRLLMVCCQAYATLTACEWHMATGAARRINISLLS